MKAVILKELNKDLIISNIQLTPLQYGQVLTKNIVSGLCGAQLQEIAGLKGNANFLPHLLGHEGCGIVEDIGIGVTKVKVGDKVVMHWRKGEGIESPFPKYIYNGKEMSSGKVTTLSEYSIVSENRLTVVPHDTPDEFCALLGCGLTTALGIINNEAQVKLGESVLVIGCGGVGLNIIQGAKLVNAYPIYGLDILDKKENIAKLMGVTEYFNINKINLLDIFKSKIDVIIDTTGKSEVISKTIDLLSNKGRYILVSQPKPNDILNINNVNKLFDGEGKIIKATQGGKTSPNEDIPRYIKLYKAGLLDINSIITHRFNLNEINEAFNILRSSQAGRIMINLNK